jgi:hypothetical protein
MAGTDMAQDAPASAPPPRGAACSDWARAQSLGPVGSAGSYNGFLLVEHPLPWPADASSLAGVQPVAAIAAAHGLRLQLVLGAHGGRAHERRLICYLRRRGLPGSAADVAGAPAEGSGGPGRPAPLEGRESVAAPERMAGLTEALLAAPDEHHEGWQAVQPGLVDLLVCTHGARDACCGSKGISLYNSLASGGPGAPVGVRLWRTSHTGGHRFAPTAVLLPQATLWAWADPPLLRAAVAQDVPVGEVTDRYRGCACVGGAPYQALDRAVLARTGWRLLGQWRRPAQAPEGWLALETEASGTWRARVTEGRRVPQPACRTAPELAEKWSVEWAVDELVQLAPGTGGAAG